MTDGPKMEIIGPEQERIIPLTLPRPRSITCPHCGGMGVVQVCPGCGQGQEAPAVEGCIPAFHYLKASRPKGMRSDRAVY